MGKKRSRRKSQRGKEKGSSSRVTLDLDQVRSYISDIRKSLQSLEKQRQDLGKAKSDLENECNRHTGELDKAKKREEKFREELFSMEKKNEHIVSQLEQFEDSDRRISELEEEYGKLRSQYDDISKKAFRAAIESGAELAKFAKTFLNLNLTEYPDSDTITISRDSKEIRDFDFQGLTVFTADKPKWSFQVQSKGWRDQSGYIWIEAKLNPIEPEN
jgi:DNA repair exonuclease SbcCD ATPase subunit